MHVEAVGRLMRRSGDRGYAQSKLPSNVDAAKAEAAGSRASAAAKSTT
jgi:hypothetical protein